MTSTKSSNNNFFSLFRDTVRRYRVWPIVTAAFSLIATVAMCSSRFSVGLSLDYSSNYTSFFVETFSIIYFIGISFLMFLATLNLFKTIYSKRASDFYFAVPVARKTTLLVNYCFTSFCSFIGLVIGTLVPIMWYISIDSKNRADFDIKYFVTKMLLMFVAVISVVAILFLCAVSSGRKWQYILSSAVMLAGFSYIPHGIMYFFKEVLVSVHIPMPKILYMISPFNLALSCDSSNIRYRYLIILMAIVIVIAMVMGVTIFNHRKVECAEQSYASKTMFIITSAVCTVVTFLQVIKISDETKGVQIAGLVIAFIIGYVISMILQKKFFTKSAVTTVAVTTACLAVFYFVTIAVGANINYQTVNADEIDSVSIEVVENDYAKMNPIYAGISGLYWDDEEDQYFQKGRTYSFKEDTSLETVCDYYNELHKDNYSDSNIMQFTFKTKSGKTVKREYPMSTYNGTTDYASRFYSLPEFIKQQDAYKLNSDDIIGIAVHSGYEITGVTSDAKNNEAVLTAVKKDMLANAGTTNNEQTAVYDDEKGEDYNGSYDVAFFCKTKYTTDKDVENFKKTLAMKEEGRLDNFVNSGKVKSVSQDITKDCYTSLSKSFSN